MTNTVKVSKTTLKTLALLVSEFPLKESLMPFQEINSLITANEGEVAEVKKEALERILTYVGSKPFNMVGSTLTKAMLEIEQANKPEEHTQ